MNISTAPLLCSCAFQGLGSNGSIQILTVQFQVNQCSVVYTHISLDILRYWNSPGQNSSEVLKVNNSFTYRYLEI